MLIAITSSTKKIVFTCPLLHERSTEEIFSCLFVVSCLIGLFILWVTWLITQFYRTESIPGLQPFRFFFFYPLLVMGPVWSYAAIALGCIYTTQVAEDRQWELKTLDFQVMEKVPVTFLMVPLIPFVLWILIIIIWHSDLSKRSGPTR